MTTGVRWRGAWKTASPERPDYAPPIQERGLREGARLRFSPGQSKDLTDTIVKWYTQAHSTTRATMVTPTTGKRIRLMFMRTINRPNAAGSNVHEIYFGTAANIAAADRIVDAFAHGGTSQSESTRSWTRGQGPLGNKDEVLSIRQLNTTSGGSVDVVIEFSEEK